MRDMTNEVTKESKIEVTNLKFHDDDNNFMLGQLLGSNATVKMAIKGNHNFIGFELDKEYYDIANKRIGAIK